MKRFLCVLLVFMLLPLLGGCSLPFSPMLPLVMYFYLSDMPALAAPVQEAAAPAQTPSPTPTPSPTASPSPSPSPAPTPFSFAWMSDTQGYAGSWSRVLDSMYGWVAEVRESENIIALLHTGDFVQDLTKTEQWLNVQRADAQLPADLLRVSVGGNHDIGSDGSDPKNYLSYRTDTQVTEEASFLDGKCRYVTLEAGGVRIIVISIAYLCEAASAEWAAAVLKEHADHYGILMVHSYLTAGENGTYLGYTSGGVILRDQVVKPSPNLRLVLCGHTHGSAMRPLPLDDDGNGTYDREVRQFLSNFQDADLSEAGFLRLLRFDTANDRIEVTTYSPFIGRYGAAYDPLGAVYTVEDAGLAAYRID